MKKVSSRSAFAHPVIRAVSRVACTTALLAAGIQPGLAAIPISTSTAYVQNFDGMGTAATAPLPVDFRVDKLTTVRTVGTFSAALTATSFAGGANLSTGAVNGIYNFGSGTTTTGPDRAIGFLSSGGGTESGNLYAQLVNNTGAPLTGLQLSYSVEKYRMGINPAGFRIQLLYSLDGQTWISAGDSFQTSFPADSGQNSGFSPAPGATVAVSNQNLNVAIPDGSNFYLAWNYSVASTTTTSNGQALAIDDISILGLSNSNPTNPTGVGAANPSTVQAGNSTLLTVSVTPGTNPVSMGIAVSADLTAIGGSSPQQFFDDGTHGDITAGDNIFSFAATVGAGIAPGTKSLPVTVSDGQSRSMSTAISLTVQSQSAPTAVKISQTYGGGGNSGATYKNDFIELFNQGATLIDVSTWSVQYAPAGQPTWTVTPLCTSAPCVIVPGRYYLVQEYQGAGGTTNLPTPDATGTTNLAATSGQVALVTNTTALTGTCPPTGSAIVDFVGYGKSGCPNSMPSALSNMTAAIRKGNGCIDTDNNQNDFLTDGPIPRNSAAPANSCVSDSAKDSGLGTASPDSVQPTAMTLLTVTVTPATTPPSTNLMVTADLSALGGSASQQFFDDGTHGDKAAGDNTFSVLTTIGASISTGPKYLVGHVTDAQGRSADVPITVSVASPTCGVEYWNVKTGTDADAAAINLNNVIPTTISGLRAIPMPYPPTGNRPTVNLAATRIAPTEFTVFQISGTLTQYKLETDVDYHLVLADANGNTIIGEVPSPACVSAQSPFLAGITNARTKMDARLSPTSGFQTANLPIQVTGVGFFDNLHGQTGVAPNGIELHAILDLNFTNQSTTLLRSSLNSARAGQSVTFTATVHNGSVSTPTGNVTFRDGASMLGTVPLDAGGRATLTISNFGAGPHTITASYEGDSKSTPSTSTPLAQGVN